MCNLYTTRRSASEIARLYPARDLTGNAPWPLDVCPDRLAPIFRHGAGGPEIALARWGMPSPPAYLPASGRDSGVTNIRNLGSPHWRRWLGPTHRCLVPVERFAEPIRGGVRWFEPSDGAAMFFAGIEVRAWRSIRKVRAGETVDDLYAFLTCQPNAEVAAIHPKAMPVILTDPDQWAAWMGGTPAVEMQRPLPDGALRLCDAG